jgi:hypothetical protein
MQKLESELMSATVDNTSFVPYNDKRYSSKLYSKNMYDIGTVWVMDAQFLPYGCSVWPALFTRMPPFHILPERYEAEMMGRRRELACRRRD